MIKVLYIEHSGFQVELEDAYFLFDYYRGELPELDPGKKFFIFQAMRTRTTIREGYLNFRRRCPIPFTFYQKISKGMH